MCCSEDSGERGPGVHNVDLPSAQAIMEADHWWGTDQVLGLHLRAHYCMQRGLTASSLTLTYAWPSFRSAQ